MRKNIRLFDDIHHHCYNPCENNDMSRIVNLNYDEKLPNEGFYSIGIHPWSTENMSASDVDSAIEKIQLIASDDRIVAIGECGIDKLRGGSLNLQEYTFIKHIELSEKLGIPLIIHAVKSVDDIIRLKKKIKPSQLWIIHGFRGKPQQALQLVNQGIALSINKNNKNQIYNNINPLMLFSETD